MTQLMFGTTQADRAYRSATAPKEMWIQHCSSSQSRDCQSRQIWSLDDLTTEERTRLENEDILVVSNPGIFNDREDALKNAQKQNKSEANQNGIITIMNPPTGDYKGWDGWKLATALPSELLYALYDKLNDSLFYGLLPLTNSEKLNQDVYLEAKAKDTSNHSRGGIPLWGMIMGDHTRAYYRDSSVIRFLTNNEQNLADEIKEYQKKTWGKIGPETKVVNFNDGDK